MINLYNGDCLEVMDKLISEGVVVDAIITDPPYGTTACKWDSIIPFDEMWLRLNKLIKPNGAIVLFGSEPFSSLLRVSNLKNYKYDWVWSKNTSAGFVHAKNMPLKKHENILIFSNAGMGHKSLLKDKRMEYNPQGLIQKTTNYKRNKTNCVNVIGARPSHKKEFSSEYTNYPTSIIETKSGSNNKFVHPTQKPVALMEYLIKTYTNENELVLDFTMGSGTTGVACKNLNRKFIGIELDDNYYKIASERINQL
jgi:site-specific DNA-methyltransferase (adenine-specific)